MSLKKAVIGSLSQVAKLRTNFRLAQLLQKFKERAIQSEGVETHTTGFVGHGEDYALGVSASQKARDYILQATSEAVDELFDEFEGMLPGGRDEASKVRIRTIQFSIYIKRVFIFLNNSQLDFKFLGEKGDIDQALIDCMMYDDDELLSAALRLLHSNFRQREDLIASLKEV
jgi:hypothetical protein